MEPRQRPRPPQPLSSCCLVSRTCPAPGPGGCFALGQEVRWLLNNGPLRCWRREVAAFLNGVDRAEHVREFGDTRRRCFPCDCARRAPVEAGQLPPEPRTRPGVRCRVDEAVGSKRGRRVSRAWRRRPTGALHRRGDGCGRSGPARPGGCPTPGGGAAVPATVSGPLIYPPKTRAKDRLPVASVDESKTGSAQVSDEL